MNEHGRAGNDPPGSAAPATQLDSDSPWPGLDAFEEHARGYFHGRDAEAEELLRRVTEAPLTVLFGKSGLGKTSLLKAGLFPRLREKHFLPIHVRLDVRPAAPALIEQLRDALRSSIEGERVDAPTFGDGETLWEYLHRVNLELWTPQNYPLTPVLVLDQFEEVFTLGERLPAEVKRFQSDFGDLAENRIPEALAARLATDAATSQRLDLRAMPYKLIVTLREDFLPHLEGWRRAVPSLGRVRVRLHPMRSEQALSAVYDTAPHLMDQPLARRIVEFVAAAQTATTAVRSDGAARESSEDAEPRGEIEPALLSLFCRGLNERRKRQGKARFDEQLLEGAQQSIISDYYRSCLEGLPDSVSRFIESELITERGFRNSYAKDDAVPGLLAQEQLDRLINRRLLRVEDRYGALRIELTHDLLTRAVMEYRDRRRLEEEKAALARRAELEKAALARRAEEERQVREVTEAQNRIQRWRQRVLALALATLVCLTLLGLAGWQWVQAMNALSQLKAASRQERVAKEAAEAARLKAEDATKRAEEASERAKQENAKLQASLSVLGNVGMKQAQAAVDQELARNPSAAKLLPRVYLQIVNEGDREHAKGLGQKLQEAGFVVLGIEYVPNATRPKNSEVRYYRMGDEGTAQKIADILSKAGEGSIKAIYLKQFENDARVRPNHYEVWFASR